MPRKLLRAVRWAVLACVVALVLTLIASLWWHVTVRVPGVFRVEISGAAARLSWPPTSGTAPPGPTQWDFGRHSAPSEWWFKGGKRVGWTQRIIPVWAPLLAMMMVYGMLWWPDRPWSPRRRPGHCRNCGYDLRGNAHASVCPECGQPSVVARLMLALRRMFARIAWASTAALVIATTVNAEAPPPPARQAAPPATSPPPDPDTDSDGLPDFWETHKYFTDPTSPDTDGDGIPDGEAEERCEHTYSVRAVIDIMAPYNLECMNDDFQDARLVWERDGFAEIEFTIYPLNTCSSDHTATDNWHVPPRFLSPYVAPGVTNNFDDDLRNKIWSALAEAGIRPDGLNDRAFAIKAAKFFDRHAQYQDGFTTFAVEFINGKPVVPADMQEMFDRELQRSGRTMQEQFDHELLGAGMFRNKTRGSCTSSAIYFSTCMRAVGIPTRTIICIPVIDASDPDERAMIANLKKQRVRDVIQQAATNMGDSWASHTFNEVFVGGRWRRLNTDRLGQEILDADVMGLMVHVNTFTDMSDAGLIAWGRRNALSSEAKRKDICGHANPYSCVALSDQVGEHAKPRDQ